MATYVFGGYAIAVLLVFVFLFWKAMRQNGSASDRKRVEYEHRKGIGPTMERLVPPLVRTGPFVNQLRGNTSLAQSVVGDTPSTWWSGDPPSALPQAVAACLATSVVAAATNAGKDGGAEVDGDDDDQKPVTAIGGLTCNADDSSPASAQADPPSAPADTSTAEEEESERED